MSQNESPSPDIMPRKGDEVLKTQEDPSRLIMPMEAVLRDLLAVIHADGGHYVHEHGLYKAIEDAKKQIYAWKTMAEIRRQERGND